MKRTIFYTMVGALALAPMALEAQTSGAQADAQTQAQARSPQARIDAALQAAARANIPTSLLESKVAEGEAKRVPPERIATAVEARFQGLLRASEALERAQVERRTEGELAVTADALQAGVSEAALITLSQNSPPERRVVAVAVLTDLVRLGRPTEHALTRVSAAVRSNAALANLHAETTLQLRRGGLNPTLDVPGLGRNK